MPLLLSRAVRLRAAALATAVLAAASSPAQAQYQEQYVAEVRLFAINYCPKEWAPAQGWVLPIAQNTALFSLLGPTYGGDGRTTFHLPHLGGRVPVGAGSSATEAAHTGLSPIGWGAVGGAESHWLTPGEMPEHTHAQLASPDPATHAAPANGRILAQAQNAALYRDGGPADVAIATSPAGNGQAIGLRNPFLGMIWCVARTGVFPQRN